MHAIIDLNCYFIWLHEMLNVCIMHNIIYIYVNENCIILCSFGGGINYDSIAQVEKTTDNYVINLSIEKKRPIQFYK